MLGWITRRDSALFYALCRFNKGMELELATVPDIVNELNARFNCPYILIFNNPDTEQHEVVWNENAFPTVFHVMSELNVCQAQFLRYLYERGLEQ